MRSIIDYILRLKDGVSGPLRTIQKEAHETDRSLDQLAGTLETLFATGIFTAGIAQAIELGGEMQKLSTSFKVMLGSGEDAADLMGQIEQLAIDTSFDRMGLSKAAKDLLNFGVAQEEVLPTLKMLGDVALGDQERLNGLAYAYSQVQGASKLMGQDLLQLINNGFNPLQIISEKTGKSMGELRKLMEEGAISADMVKKAFESATSAGGRFYNGAGMIAETGIGQLQAMLETAQGLAVTFGVHLLESLKPVFNALRSVYEVVSENEGAFLTITATVTGFMGAVLGIASAIKIATVAQGIFNVVLAANPIGIVITLVAALAAGVYTAYQRFEGFRAVVDGIGGALKQFGQNIMQWVNSPMEMLNRLMGKTLAPFFEAIALVREGNFMGAAKALGKGLLGLTPVGLAMNTGLFDNVGEAYYAASSASKVRSATGDTPEKVAEAVSPADPNEDYWKNLLNNTTGKGAGSGDTLRTSEISARAPRIFNINIERQVGIETMQTTVIKESMAAMERMLKEVMLKAINDSQNIATR